MGSSNSLPVPRYGCCIRPHNPDPCVENHASRCASGVESQRSTRSTRSHHRRNLSATFNFTDTASDSDYRPPLGHDLININTATEEELMTLSAVNRATAHNIVEYRRLLAGGFRKVEDLALVSGVGAMRMSVIRSEITVGGKNRSGHTLSKNSSTSSSGIDLTMPADDVSHGSVGGAIIISAGANINSRVPAPQSKDVKVNVNAANVFQLMKVKLITQALAENIVEYRSRRGRFTSIDDLVKVKGIKSGLIGAIRQNLILEDEPVVSTNTVEPDSIDNSRVACNAPDGDQRIISSHGLPKNGQVLNDDVDQELISLYGPLLRKSFRASTRRPKPLAFRNSLRIATWNLQRCGKEKAKNHGVKEVVAMTILENELSIVVVQDLLDDQALQLFCDELNTPTLPAVKKWSGSKGHWRCSSLPLQPSNVHHSSSQRKYLGFMYDQSRCSLSESFVRPVCPNQQSISSVITTFKVRNFRLAIVNVQLSEASCEPVKPSEMFEFIERFDACNPDVNCTMAVGQLDTITNATEDVSRSLKSVLDSSNFTDIGLQNLKGSVCHQNIWIKSSLQHLCAGQGEVIREGLSSPWIPDGWSWGGMASDCCPVWIELNPAVTTSQIIQDIVNNSDADESWQDCE